MQNAHRGAVLLLLSTLLNPPVLPAADTGLTLPPEGAGPSAPGSPRSDPFSVTPAPTMPPAKGPPSRPGDRTPETAVVPYSAPESEPQTHRPSPSPIESSFRRQDRPSAPTRSIEQFGYGLFAQPASLFAPVPDAPVGPDYILGPGDTLIIRMWGLVEQSLEASVDRGGQIFLPKVGPLTLWGLTLAEAKALIKKELSRYFTKFQLSISMGPLRTIKVFVLGEAARPGAYDLSAVSTLSNVLFVAGGPSKIGTMRRIQHFRRNVLVGELDLYDLLLRGDKAQDARVESGDVLFIPTVGTTVGITGHVKRPAIYELTGGETVDDLITMAGGITPLAYLGRVQIERIQTQRQKILIDLDLTENPGNRLTETPLQNGDLVKVFAIHGRIEDVVHLEGFIRHPGEYAYVPGMHVRELLLDGALLPESYLDQAEVIRLKADLTSEVIPFNIRKLRNGEDGHNVRLFPGDRVVIASEFRPPAAVTLSGEVMRPGRYTLSPGERLSSVLRRAGGFSDNAYLPSAVFTRRSVLEQQQREIEAFIQVQEERLLAESSAVAAAGIADSEAKAEQLTLTQRRELLKVLASKVTLGRIVVHLDAPDKLAGTVHDIVMEDGDQLTVPTPPSSVVVLGAVRNATGILHREGANLGYYLQQAGGPTEDADPDGIYLIKADGSAIPDVSRRTAVDRGDTLVVPISTEAKYRPIPLWRDIATIIGQVAITIAAMVVVF